MAKTSTKFIGIQLHGCGVANSGDYPDICVSLEITFTRSSSTSKSVSWSVGGVDLSTGAADSYRYDYPFYCKLVVGSSSHNLISKGSTSGSGWRSSVTKYEDFSGSFSSTSSSVTVKFQVEGGHCLNDGQYCFGSSGWYTVYSKSVSIPSYSSGSSGGGGGGGSSSSASYNIYYLPGRGTGAPSPQSITQGKNVVLSTQVPQFPFTVKYYNYPNGGSFDLSQFTDSETVYRRFVYWQSYYSRNNHFQWIGKCDGEHTTYPRHFISGSNINYAYSLPSGVDKINFVVLMVGGRSITLYNWTSGQSPKDSNYPYYWALETATFPGQAYYEGKCITIGIIENKVFKPTPPPKGAQLNIDYNGADYSYRDAGEKYYPGDTYDTSGKNGTRDVYMIPYWDTGVVQLNPMPDGYKKVNFDYNGGTGSPDSMAVLQEKLGYYHMNNRLKTAPAPDSGLRIYYKPNSYQELSPSSNQEDSTPLLYIQDLQGDGSTTEFTLDLPCYSIWYVKIDGQVQPASSYSVRCRTLTFETAPAAETEIEVKFEGVAVYFYEQYTGDGVGNTFILEELCDFAFKVKVDGVVQEPGTYTWYKNSVTLNFIPASGSIVDIEYLQYNTRSNELKGDGTTKVFTLRGLLSVVESVAIDDVIQDPSTYTADEFTLTFETAPANNANIMVRYYSNVIYTDWGAQLYMLGTWGVGRVPYDQLPIPKRASYAFEGWYYDNAFTEPVSREEGLIIPASESEITIHAKWYELPIRQFGKDGKWHSIDCPVWQFCEDQQWHKVAHVYKFIEDEEGGHWEDISGIFT